MSQIKKCETIGCPDKAEWRLVFTERREPELITEYACTECKEDYERRAIRKYESITPFPPKLAPAGRAYHVIGDRVELVMPHSEVCMHMRVAGQPMIVEIKEHSAQLYKPDGTIFSSPILWGEAGIYTDRENDNLPYVVTNLARTA